MGPTVMQQLLFLFYKEEHQLRLGQWFFINYINKGTWEEMFYGHAGITYPLIEQWLEKHQYYCEPPRNIRDGKHTIAGEY